MLGYVVTQNSYIRVGSFLNVNPVRVGGPEVEGGPGTLAARADQTVPVVLLGPQTAMQGYYLICRHVDYRWVADLGSNQSSTRYATPTCPCQTTPRTLYMTVNNPALDNYMFQSGTIQLQPKPSWTSPLPLPDPMYLSTQPLICQDVGPNNGIPFYYSFECYQGYYVLFRLFPTCTFGTPYREAVRYQWVIGYQGSTCNPFVLPLGIGFAGMDSGIIVSIVG